MAVEIIFLSPPRVRKNTVNKGKVAQAKSDLETHFRDQLKFLVVSVQAYDQGEKAEAKRLALALRILIHDTARSSSLMNQLELKTMPFLDTALVDGKGQPAVMGLVAIRVDPKTAQATFRPNLDSITSGRKVTFDQWWNWVVLIDKNNQFTRKDLVLWLADQDGGAHVDPDLDAAYAALSRQNSMRCRVKVNGKTFDIESPVPASVRQITYEFLQSVQASCPDYL